MNNANEKTSNLPAHLQSVVDKYENRCKEFGINPNWASEAKKKAEERGHDFNPIHGMIG